MSTESRRAVRHVVALVLFEVAAVGGLHVIGTQPSVGVDWSHISRWLATTPVDQVAISMVWLVAVALAWWTLGSTLLYLVTRIRGFRAGARIAERLAFPMIRQMVDRAVATTVVTSVLLGTTAPALADERPPPPVTQQAPATLQYEPEPAGSENAETEQPSTGAGPQRQAPEPVEQAPSREEQPTAGDEPAGTEEQPEARPGPGEDAAAAQMASESESPEGIHPPARESEAATEDKTEDKTEDTARDKRTTSDDTTKTDKGGNDTATDTRGRRSTPQAGSRYTVRAGDHLWKIAVEVVAANGDKPERRRAIASYWAELVRVATPHLQSGDPNLIYPGEELELPPLHDATGDRR